MALGNPITLTGNVSNKTLSVLATEGQTTFTISGGYVVNHISVFRNGVRLSHNEDFTASDGSTVVLANACSVDDAVTFQIFEDFHVSDAIVGSATSQVIQGDLRLTGDFFYEGEGVGMVTSLTAGENISLSGSQGGVTITGLAKTDVIVAERILVSGVTTSTGGFVGNVTGTATGLTGEPAITVSTISATGNVSIAGTLTYEDVTNVDSVGLVTAQSGVIASGIGVSVTTGAVTVGSAVTANSTGIDVVGVVTATSFSGNGAALTGIESWNQQDTWLYGG